MHQVSSASQTVSSSYLYNQSNQRTNATAADGSYWVYAYDDHGQVVSGKRYWADGTLVAGQQFEYGFDDIGNRTNTSSGGDDQGNNMRASSYTTNYQNEVTQLVVPSYEEIQGTANELATVTVNGLNTYRKGEYFRYELPVSNSSGAAYSAVSVISSISGLSDTTSGNVYSPPASEWCYYDDDGNLTYDGRWYYTWNAENRLIAMQAGWVTSGSQALRRRLEFKYDGKGRRIEKKIYKYNTSTSSFSDLLESWTYVYDGWNLIAEIRKAPFYDGIRRSYMWGPDLSGSMQGAGGVGGLLMITDHTGVSHEHHYVGYDGNGNVTVLVDANIGTITGRYEYGPFGEPLRASGEAIAIENPFRFSTKFTDKESGYLYYGFRYYNPETGRWLNRDPIAEEGGFNLYAFSLNSPLNRIDPDGKESWIPGPWQPPTGKWDDTGWAVAIGDLFSWLTGDATENCNTTITYGDEDTRSQHLRNSEIAGQLREFFLEKNKGKVCEEWEGVTNFRTKFGPYEFINDLANGTAHFVGRARGAIFIESVRAGECKIVAKFRMTNTTSLKSGLYHIWPDDLNNPFPGSPGCNWRQNYEWTEEFSCK